MKNQTLPGDMRPPRDGHRVVFLETLRPAPDCTQLETDYTKMEKRGEASVPPSSQVLVACKTCAHTCASYKRGGVQRLRVTANAGPFPNNPSEDRDILSY